MRTIQRMCLLVALLSLPARPMPVAAQAVSPTPAAPGRSLVLVGHHRVLGKKIPAELLEQAAKIDIVSPMWLGAGDTGEITALEDCAAPYDDYRAAAKAAGVKLMPIVRNFAPQPMLADKAAIARFVDDAEAVCDKHQFDGLVIDFEQLKQPSRQPLVDLMAALHPRLTAKSKLLIIAVAPKAWEKEFDYAALAQHSDYLYVMTYDYVGPWNKAVGPTAPINWPARPHDLNRDLAALLALNIPPAKILLGMPLYGVDFTLETPDKHEKATPLYLNQIAALREKHKATRQWDDEKKAAWFTYEDAGKNHAVWYDDAESFTAKLDLAKRLGLGGIACWALRYPKDSVGADLWSLLPTK